MTPEIGLGKCVYLLVGRCTVTLLPNFLGWVDLLSYGAPKRAWSSVNNNNNNNIKAANTWAVSLMRYGAGTIKWNKEELQEIDRKSRKIKTMNKELQARTDVSRIYVPRKKGGRGLISGESCVRREENNLSWYVRNSEEALLRKVGDSNVVNISEAVDPEEYKVDELKETENEWKQKRLHGQYVREKEGIDWDRTWQWIAKGRFERMY